jgi:hypothetical protein
MISFGALEYKSQNFTDGLPTVLLVRVTSAGGCSQFIEVQISVLAASLQHCISRPATCGPKATDHVVD